MAGVLVDGGESLILDFTQKSEGLVGQLRVSETLKHKKPLTLNTLHSKENPKKP